MVREIKLRGLTVMMMAVTLSGCASTPEYQGWTPEQLYQYGDEALNAGDWGEAQSAFERLVISFPAFEEAVAARHGLAESFYFDEEYLSAVSEYTRIVQVYPDDPRTPEAWMGLCRSYAALAPHPQRDQQYTVQARTTCQNVANDFRGTPVGDSASATTGLMTARLAERAYAEGHFYMQRDVLESAELVFLDLLDTFPGTPSVPSALARLVEIYTVWGWEDQLDVQRARLLSEFPNSPEARALTALTVEADTASVSPQPVGNEPFE